MTDLEVKAAVRERDGHKCRDCGMTQEEHLAKYEKAMDVHRLLPGSEYRAGSCITLCRACHGKKPKDLWDVVGGDEAVSGVFFLGYLNLYDRDHRELFLALQSIAEAAGVPIHQVVGRALNDYAGLSSPDYCI